MTKLRQSGGFTLLEVLIVVAIIIIIAGIALPRFLGVSEQGRKARSVGDLRVLQTAVESYAINTNAAPGNDSEGYTNLTNAVPAIISKEADFKDPFSANGASSYVLKTVKNTTTGKIFHAAGSRGPNGTTDLAITDTGTLTKEADDIVVSNNVS